MADLEITANELGTIDTNQISQITLKDGTLIMVNGGAEQAQPEEEFVQEEQAQEEQVQEEQAQEIPAEEGQENQLRHRPMMPMMMPPRPMIHPRPMVPPPRRMVPPVPMRPMVVPRGPAMRTVAPVFRARPGMHMPMPPRPHVVPPKVIPGPVPRPVVMPRPVPKRVIAPVPMHKPGMMMPPRPMPVGMGFRARPNTEPDEEAAEYEQEEVAGEDQYAEYDQEEDYQVDDLRHRPMMMVPPPRHMPMRPRVMPPPMIPHRRGPMMAPMMGYNTFQPRVFRHRPRPRIVPVPMFTPLNTTFQPRMMGMRGPRYGPMPPMMRPPLYFRGKERSNSYDEAEQQQQECQENQEQQCEEQKCTKSVCTKCGKEF